MVLHFKGGYRNNNDILPHEELKRHKNAVKFKEFDNAPVFMLLVNMFSIIILIITGFIFHLKAGIQNVSLSGVLLVLATLIPHEIIHAMFFRSDVYIYVHHLALLITGTEPMSKNRYIMMCLTPTVVFGFIPFVLFLINPSLTTLGTLGAISIALGLGDFYNIFHCITQVPKNGLCFMNKQNTYWYVPENIKEKPDFGWKKQSVGSNLMQLIAILLSFFILSFGLYNNDDIVTTVIFLSIEISFYCIIGYMQIKYIQSRS